VLQKDHYYPFGLNISALSSTAPLSKPNQFKYNGKEEQTEFDLGWMDYGARMYDPQIGRWNHVDALANLYEGVSPYVYALNDPINAIDPDGNLVVFVNGLMLNQWMSQDNRRTANSFTDGRGAHIAANPNYRPYPPARNPTTGSPSYLGESFDYWGNIDDVFQDGYNSLYVSATADNSSQAVDRFAEGEAAANSLIAQLDNAPLAEGETIKIVGHSQGAAFAAGMASVLSKHEKYSSRLEAVYYLAPHQPESFDHPSDVEGHQFSRKSDMVSSAWWSPLMLLNGGSDYSKINGISNDNFHELESYRGGQGGHYVDTYLDNIVEFFRGLGIPVTVKN
jgi:RHS repeat-associated protein